TCYYVKLIDEHIDTGIDVLSDMILNSKFDKNDIDKERLIILEELKMYEDSPDDLSYDLLVENIYANDGLGMNIIGTKESLYNITRESMLEYLNKYYIPNNAVISIAGNFNFDDMVEKIKSKFGHWEKKNLSIDISEAKFNPCFISKNKDTEQVNLAMCLKGIPFENDEEVYSMAVVNNIFGGSISSRLFQKIREEKGLVYSIYSSQTLYRKCGELGIFASMSTENLQDVYNLIKKEIENIRENYLTEKEISESKEQLKGNYILDLESTSSRMMSTGKSMLLSKKVKTTDEILECINNVNINSIKKVVDKVFNIENIGTCIVGRDVEKILHLD
ncbi:MAG: pitrilysin family protein, partial [Clostridioides difficile]|nr:pitrilysin family protein [Clostridioides difficile]